ncbi:hypothetical protein ABH917_002418 [Thermobifida halotolerans]
MTGADHQVGPRCCWFGGEEWKVTEPMVQAWTACPELSPCKVLAVDSPADGSAARAPGRSAQTHMPPAASRNAPTPPTQEAASQPSRDNTPPPRHNATPTTAPASRVSASATGIFIDRPITAHLFTKSPPPTRIQHFHPGLSAGLRGAGARPGPRLEQAVGRDQRADGAVAALPALSAAGTAAYRDAYADRGMGRGGALPGRAAGPVGACHAFERGVAARAQSEEFLGERTVQPVSNLTRSDAGSPSMCWVCPCAMSSMSRSVMNCPHTGCPREAGRSAVAGSG